jgi:hypothetical protein
MIPFIVYLLTSILRYKNGISLVLLKNLSLRLGSNYYLVPVSESDRMIPPAVEHMFTKQMNATTISLPASHASLESHPQEIAQLVLNATGK